jgi:hypothetical protein
MLVKCGLVSFLQFPFHKILLTAVKWVDLKDFLILVQPALTLDKHCHILLNWALLLGLLLGKIHT